MRSLLPRSLRALGGSLIQPRTSFTGAPYSFRCLSSTPSLRRDDERIWSTPLAKQLADALSVSIPGWFITFAQFLTYESLGDRPGAAGQLTCVCA